MKYFTLLFALLFALPALGQTRIMHMGDPQVGRGCVDSPFADDKSFYFGMSEEMCAHRQGRQFRALVDYGVARGVSAFLISGDTIGAWSTPGAEDSPHRHALRDVINDYPNEKFMWASGIMMIMADVQQRRSGPLTISTTRPISGTRFGIRMSSTTFT